MPIEKSLSAYRKGRQNCAQSVYTGFRELLHVSPAVIEEAKKHGGGKVEGGLCGALHAALELSQHDETKKTLRDSFKELAGSLHCREIRIQKKMSCDQCVELAATLLDQLEHSKPKAPQGST